MRPKQPATKVTARGGVETAFFEAGYTRRTLVSPYESGSRSMRVYVDAFRFGKTHVTVGQFRQFCRSTGYQFDWKGLEPTWGWHDDRPMVNVDWSEARAFCKWAGGDLPTASQWHRARPLLEEVPYAPNPLLPRQAHFIDGPGEAAEPVRPAPKDAVGWRACTGMGDQVAEWCLDWAGEPTKEDRRNPTGPKTGTMKVLLGGPGGIHWEHPSNRASKRSRWTYFGIRVATPS